MKYTARLVEPASPADFHAVYTPVGIFRRSARVIITGYTYEQAVEIIYQIAQRKNLHPILITPA